MRGMVIPPDWRLHAVSVLCRFKDIFYVLDHPKKPTRLFVRTNEPSVSTGRIKKAAKGKPVSRHAAATLDSEKIIPRSVTQSTENTIYSTNLYKKP